MIENDMFPRTEDDTPAIPAAIFQRRLIWLFLLWSPALLAIRILNSPWLWLYEIGMLLSLMVAAVLVVIALRHRPVLHRFLKVAITFSLCLMVLTNYTSASIASHGSFFPSWTKDYNSYSFLPFTDKLWSLFTKYVTLPTFLGPLTDQNMPLLWFCVVIQQYSLLFGPYFLLLLLVTPFFLALPIFWLWVVLSMLYVVLPLRAWRWMRTRTGSLWKRIQG